MNDFIKQKYDELTGITYKFLQGRNLNQNKFWDYPLAADEAGEKQEFQIALSQNMEDLKKVIMDCYAYCCKENLFDDFVTCFAMYCNHYIKYGLTCLSEDTEDTMFGLQKADFTNSGDETLLPYLNEIWLGIKTQQYSHFEDALSINNTFSVAHLYLFTQKAEIYFWFVEYMDKIQNCPLNLYRNVIFKLGEKGFEFFSLVYDSPNESVQEKLTEINNILDNMDASYENYYHITSVPTDLLNDFCKITSEYADKIKKFIINSYHNFKSQNKQTDFLIFFCQCLREINSFASGIEKDLNPLLFPLFRSYFLFVRNMEDFKQTINVNDNELICHITENDFDASDFSRLKLFTSIVSDETLQIWIKLNACSEKTKKEILQEIHQYSSSPEEEFKAKIRDRYYSNMIEHYKWLSPNYQEYVRSSGNYYYELQSISTNRGTNSWHYDSNALPHICFTNDSDKTAESIVDINHFFETNIINPMIKKWSDDEKEALVSVTEKSINGTPLLEKEKRIIEEFNNKYPEYTEATTNHLINLDNMIEQLGNAMRTIPDITFTPSHNPNYSLTSETLQQRTAYLNLYHMVRFKTGQNELKELFNISMSLEQRNEELEQAKKELEQRNNELIQTQEEKTQIINDFSHTYSNMLATSLYYIAKELLSSDNEAMRHNGRKLLLEYENKMRTTMAVEMLRMQFEEKNEQLKKYIIDSMGDSDTGIPVSELFQEALQRCIITLLLDGSTKGEFLRFAFEMEEPDRKFLLDKFETEITSGEQNILKWTQHYIMPVHFDDLGTWKTIYFNKDGYAASLVISIFSEFVRNIFKYADKTKNITFVLHETESKLIITAQNTIKEDYEVEPDGGAGLQSKNTFLKHLDKQNTVSYTHTQKEFSVKAEIVKSIFIR